MTEVTLAIGAAAVCTDGSAGELKALVVDPASGAVTHLVVEPQREHGLGLGLARLVPFRDADASAEPIALACTEAEFRDLSPAEETLAEFVPGYGSPVQLLPAGEGWRPADDQVAAGETIPLIREMETIPLVPQTDAGTPEVAESGADHVRATDGEVGRLSGLRVEEGSGLVRYVLVRRHPWGHAELAVPISRVAGFDDGVQLSITRQDVRDLA